MKKKTKFILTSIWILSTRSYDAFATYQYTPDLSHEANPLVSIFGLSWIPLLIIIGVLSILSIYAYYQSLFKPYNLFPIEKGYSLSEFIGFTYSGKRTNWTALLFRLPNTINRFTHFMGHLLTRALVFAGIVSTLMWFGLNYTEFYMKLHSAPFIYSLLILGTSLIMYFWFKERYKEYQTATLI